MLWSGFMAVPLACWINTLCALVARIQVITDDDFISRRSHHASIQKISIKAIPLDITRSRPKLKFLWLFSWDKYFFFIIEEVNPLLNSYIWFINSERCTHSYQYGKSLETNLNRIVCSVPGQLQGNTCFKHRHTQRHS